MAKKKEKVAKVKQQTKQLKKEKSKPTKKTKSNESQVKGKFVGNERGFGFVLYEGGVDIFIPPHSTNGALHGDEVICKPESRKKREGLDSDDNRLSGKIVDIIRREPIIGTFLLEGKQGFVRPIENKIPYMFSVPPKTIARFGLVDGHRVVFSVDKKHKPEENLSRCFVTEVLGHVNDVGVDILTLIRQAGVPYDFSEEVNEELLAIPTEVLAEEIPNRLDLRGERIFTIDGDDTKDIDDAISFAATEEGFTLGVHIADVTFYVREGSALDASALERGTSVYLADRVIPMLPHKLSSGICSLFPYVDRLTLSCIMTIDKSGNVTDYKIAQSIINSSERFTYTQVQELLDRGENEQLNQMDELRRILRNKRERRGALDFDIPESKIRIDDLGNVISIEPQPRNNATGIIEEFMILCNETIATHFLMRKLPFVYRTHDAPSVEKLLGLQKLIQNLGLNISAPDRANSSTLQKFLDAAKETSVAYAISSAVLHALPQACYTSDNPTHFGLASKAYCHFTSPIRRYADLQIHRIIKIAANEDFSTPPTEIIPAIENFRAILPAVCTQCSRTERTAEALERDVAELKKAQFMADKEGQSFEAIISGITAWGAFVLLNNTVEGLIPATNLQRHKFKHNKEKGVYEKTKREAGEKRPQILHHGTKVTVRLTQANTEERRLTFVLCKETKT